MTTAGVTAPGGGSTTMPAVPEIPGTPWAARRLGGTREAGGRLLFARMYEDHRIEEAALAGSRRILAIASAGDTAMALARSGAKVTAIDVNPAQITLLEGRLGGAPDRQRRLDSTTPDDSGQAERIMAAGRGILRLAGWRQSRMERFCDLDDPMQQVAEWRRLVTGLPGFALPALLGPAALRAAYQPDFARWAGGLGRRLPDRIEAGLACHPNRDNPWARLLFLGDLQAMDRVDHAEPGTSTGMVSTLVGDVADHLERVETASYDGFALSNVLDGAPVAYRRRLLAAVERSGTPDAPVVLRTLGPPASPAESHAARADRALIWGGITVAGAGALR